MRKLIVLPVFIFLACCLFPSDFFSQTQSEEKRGQNPPIYYNAENLRSDTFDILKYTISLEVTNTTTAYIKGNTQVRFSPKINNRPFIRLDLLKLTIDSVKENNNLLTYSYNDTVVKINFTTNKNVTDTSVITVFYKGTPKIDASGWGGVYVNSGQGTQYIYNMGVGFAAKPHNYGRVWFPCFDNFVERSKYEFNITCDSARKAYCGGLLVSDVLSGAKRTRKWVLNQTIPTYLASFSLAKFAEVNWSANALNGPKPIVLAAVAADTATLKTGFVNLKNCVTGFENYFGPYMWDRIGFNIVPFFGGAMEHATNITYPRFAIGNMNYEDLMAHEFSHHWWGNLITCETPEDMWINEGFATFSAYMFFEWQYGKDSYLSRVKTEHDNLLHFLFKTEGFRAVSGVPSNLTYGDHVYKKGADIAHTLRGYMGDAAFFTGIKYTMQQKAYNSINSNEFRDLLQTNSGQNLTDYFSNWVFSPGWAHYSIDSVKYLSASSGSFNAVVSIKQKLFGATVLHNNVPLELSFFKTDQTRIVRTIIMSGASQTFTINIPYQAAYCALNYDSKINDATSHEYHTIKSIGPVAMPFGKVPLQVKSIGTDSSLVRIIHNYVKPDPFKFPVNHLISNQHYWKVEGMISPGFVAEAQFSFNGFKGTSGTFIYMDTLLTRVNCDSIALFYRENVSMDWRWVKKAVKVKANIKSGYFTLDTLKLGEYVFANLGDTLTVGQPAIKKSAFEVKIFPNPASQRFSVELEKEPQKTLILEFTNMEGKTVLTDSLSKRINNLETKQLLKGAYTITIRETEGWLLHSQKFVIE